MIKPPPPYDPTACDLCGESGVAETLTIDTPRSLRSDGLLLPIQLRKFVCSRCGLVRDGHGQSGQAMQAMYTEDYRPATAEYIFHTPDGPLTRSGAFYQWIVNQFGESAFAAGSSVLEVGAGTGGLVANIQNHHPDCKIEGIDLSRASVEAAQRRGRAVRLAEIEEIASESQDTVISVAVLEHVPSPRAFLSQLVRVLKPGGALILTQPTQDVPSHDILFADHLHHFASGHVTVLGLQVGLEPSGLAVGHRWMPNYSLHLFRKAVSTPPAPGPWQSRPLATSCAETIRRIGHDMEMLNAQLSELDATQTPYAVFGLSEVFNLTLAYSELTLSRLKCGLVDEPLAAPQLPLEVHRPEEARGLGVEDVFLTVNTQYYLTLEARLQEFGLRTHRVLS